MGCKTKTVIVAEDEVLIRMSAVGALEHAGFAVIEAEHAEHALSHLLMHAPRVHLLFTDIHMPGEMDGLALAHHVRATWPHVALILASGDARPEPHALPAGGVFITKPYDLDHVTMHARTLTSI